MIASDISWNSWYHTSISILYLEVNHLMVFDLCSKILFSRLEVTHIYMDPSFLFARIYVYHIDQYRDIKLYVQSSWDSSLHNMLRILLHSEWRWIFIYVYNNHEILLCPLGASFHDMLSKSLYSEWGQLIHLCSLPYSQQYYPVPISHHTGFGGHWERLLYWGQCRVVGLLFLCLFVSLGGDVVM